MPPAAQSPYSTPPAEVKRRSQSVSASLGLPMGQFMKWRLRAGLARTRAGLSDALGDLLTGRRQIDDELMEEIETLLLTADVGVNATRRIIDDLTARVRRKELADPEALGAALRERLTEILHGSEAPFAEPAAGRPLVILMVGINGAGKTTTVNMLATLASIDAGSASIGGFDVAGQPETFRIGALGEVHHHRPVAVAHHVRDPLDQATAQLPQVLRQHRVRIERVHVHRPIDGPSGAVVAGRCERLTLTLLDSGDAELPAAWHPWLHDAAARAQLRFQRRRPPWYGARRNGTGTGRHRVRQGACRAFERPTHLRPDGEASAHCSASISRTSALEAR